MRDSCNLFPKLCNAFTVEFIHLCIKTNNMKKMKVIVGMLLLGAIIFSTTSCAVRLDRDNRRQHRGWFHKHENRHDNDRNVLIIGQENHDNSSSSHRETDKEKDN